MIVGGEPKFSGLSGGAGQFFFKGPKGVTRIFVQIGGAIRGGSLLLGGGGGKNFPHDPKGLGRGQFVSIGQQGGQNF